MDENLKPHLKALLAPAEAAAYLGVSERHLRRLVSERRIAYVKERHLVRFLAADLDAWIEKHRVTEGRP